MRRLRDIGPELLIILGGAAFAVLGRGRWADVLVDHGLCFSNAQGVLSGGQVLHDVRIQYGPVSVWLLVGVLKIFGVRVSTVVGFQFLIGLAGVVLLQIFSRRFLSSAERWLCAALLVIVILWMSGPGNLLYPYRFAVSHALLAAMISLEIVARGIGRGRLGIAAAIGGGIAGLAFATKQEIGAAALGGVFLIIVFADGLPVWRKVRALALAGLASGAACAVIISVALHGRRFMDFARANLLWPWAPVPESWNQLYRRSQGWEHPGRVFLSLADTLLIAAVFGGSIWLLVYGTRVSRNRIRVVASALVAGWALWAWRWTEGSHFLPLALCLPLLIASAGLTTHRVQRGEIDWKTAGSAFAVIAGAALLLSREGFRGGSEGFYSGMGYVLAIPASVPVLGAVARGPSAAGRRRWIVAALALVLLGRAGAERLAALRSHWDSLVPFTTARGTVYSDPSSTGFLKREATIIESRTRPGDSILMIPVTGGLDFLLDRRNESFFPNLVPGVIVGEGGERELIDRWKVRPPRVVIEIRGALGVFRLGDFGEGWGRAAQRWISENYRPLPPIDPAGRVSVWAPGKLE